MEYIPLLTFDLIPFTCGTHDGADPLNLRTNPFQQGGSDGRSLTKELTTRVMVRRVGWLELN